jgi:hypothetical protein
MSVLQDLGFILLQNSADADASTNYILFYDHYINRKEVLPVLGAFVFV